MIDGATGTMVTAIPGSGPRGMGINIVTNRIYAANEGNNTIQVINGADNSVITTVPVGAGIGIDRGSVAVNPLTNKIYVVSQTTNTISVIDGVTNIATTVPVGLQPYYIAVNPATNKVYVSNRSSHNVMVINGTTNAITATITGIGAFPDTIAINPKTNKIYVNQSEIDGVTNAVMPVAGVVGRLVGVNPNNNKVFYYNPSFPGSGSVSVFDATSKTASTLAGLNNIRGVSLDTVSNKLYLADGPLHIYDATLNALTSVAVGAFTVTVNPITGKAYATPDANAINVTDFSVVTAANEQDIPLAAAITTLPGNTTQTGRPLFGFGAATTFAPTAPALGKLYYQVDSRMGTWTEAPASGPGYAATLAPLLPGEHTIFAYATDGQDATSVNSGFQSGPLTSKVVAYTFVVTAEGQLAVTSVNGGSSTTFGAPFNVVVEAHDGAPTQNVTRDTVVQLSVATGTGTLGGTTSCTILTGNSFCTVTGVTYSKAETGVVLRASTTSGMVLTSANSAAFDQAKGNQTITFNALGNKTFGDAAFAVSATGGASGNAVTFSSTTTGICTVAGSTVTIIAGGTCTVRASQAGNTNYNAATDVDQSFTVNPANQTITFGALSNHVFGSADFTVGAGASSGLAVTFSSTTTGVCTVTGNTVSIVAGGTCTVRASQAGNTNYNAAPDVDRSFTVTQASQSITSGSLGSKTFGDAPFTVSGSATSGLPVTFTSTDTAVCTVSGNTVTIVAVGSCAILVSQAGNGNYSAAISVTSSFTVSQASQVITFGALGNKTFGDAAFDVSAMGGASGNTNTFSSQTSGVCTVVGSTVTIVSAGTCTVRASQAGNANYAAASNVDQSFTVNQISQAVTFGALGNKTFGDAAFDVSATGGASGNPVTFSSTTASICSVSGSTVTLAAVGSCNIHASQAGNGNYAAATDVDQNFNVAAAPVTNKNVVISASPNPPVAGQPVVFIITVTGTNPTGTVTIKDGTTVIGTVDVSKGTGRFTTANLPAGSHSLTGSYAGDANNPAGGSDPEVVVVPAGGTLNPVSAGSSPNQPKDNETVTFTATVAGNNPTGEIIFLDGATEIGRAPVVNGKASFTAPKFKSGKHPILMRYSGDSNNATADSPIATIDVQSSDSGGGGGCAIDLNATFDPTLLLMALAAMGYTVRRRQQGK